MKKEGINKKKLIWLSIFAIAFGLLEAVVVIYLRKLYYPQGFTFPLTNPLFLDIIKIEILREISTLVILLSIAIIAGKNLNQKLAYFFYTFAIWDIFYYIWLKLLINWPASLLTWDVLFLIPIVWISPVIAPVIVSLVMIAIAFILLNYPRKKIKLKEILLTLIGFFLIFITFIWDYSKLAIQNQLDSQFVPSGFNWILFAIGIVLILIGLALYSKRKRLQ